MADLDKQKKYPVIAVREVVAFPGTVLPLYVGRTHSLNAVESVLESDGLLLCLTQKDAEIEDVGVKDLYRFGTLVKILQAVKMPDGTFFITSFDCSTTCASPSIILSYVNESRVSFNSSRS